MGKQFITTVLQRIKDNMVIHQQLYDIGIDATDFFDKTGYISLLEEAVATMLCKGDENRFELILNDIQWWLYEGVDKIIWYEDKQIIVESTEQYVNWLFEHYECNS